MTADDRQRRDPLRDPLRLDPKSVRRTFERAAATYDSAAVLQREIGQRMADRLALVKLQPAAILDAGCGTGDALSELRTRFPAAFIVGLDLAHAMLVAASVRAPSLPSSHFSTRYLSKLVWSNSVFSTPASSHGDIKSAGTRTP